MSDNEILELARKYNLNELVVKLLFSRKIDTEQKINKFFNPSINDFHDPFLLSGMKEAVARIKKAMQTKDKVLIFGDYDVDGVSASAILIKYFSSCNFYVDYYLPNRYIDGYGLTCEAIDKVKAKYNPKLIITVDCGISCVKEVEYAKSLGIEIIITDHHDIPEHIPDCIVVDPKLTGQKYPFSELCGTGVAFKLVQALADINEAMRYIGICAIATIADIVPLVDENRAIVSLGLKGMPNNLPTGIKMLLKDNKMTSKITATDISFRLSPKINAAGRMGDATVSLRLYLKEDKKQLATTIDILNNMNIERQALCNKVYEEAVARLNKINIANYYAIALYSKQWDSGILGIVSARIASEYNKPTVLFSEVGDELRGSARSINDIDIYSIISSIKEAVQTFGGHKMAAGLTIKTKSFNSFIKSLNEALRTKYTSIDYMPREDYDFELDPRFINDSFVKDLDVLEPCGCGNPKPMFCLNFDKVNVTTLPNHPNHINITTDKFNMVAFNGSRYIPALKSATSQKIVVEFQLSEFKNKCYVKGIAKQIFTGQIAKPKNNDVIYGEYIKQLYNYTASVSKHYEYSKTELNNIIKTAKDNLLGTLFVANTYETYIDFISQFNSQNNMGFKHYIFEVTESSGINSIILSPSSLKNFNQFNKIIFLDAILDKNYLHMVTEHTNAKLFIPNFKGFDKNIFSGISSDRNIFVEYFKMLQDLSAKMLSHDNELMLYKNLKNFNLQNKNINFKQFIYCLYTFIELGIFIIEQESDFITIKEDKMVFSSLTNSKFYNDVNLILQTLI